MKNTDMRKILCGVSLSALVFTSAPALAQDTGNDGFERGDDIVVTARRFEERLQDVPISITVFNQEQLSNRNVVTAADLATYTPSLSSNARYGGESSSFAIRGFIQEGPTTPSVGVYFAEVVAPRANGATTAGNGAGVGAYFDLQNVQVLKGPQGTLFGRNTTGGAVLLVPQKPTQRLEGYVEGTLGNYDLRRLQAVVNVPLADTVQLRLGVDRQKRDGYLRNVSGIGPEDFGNVDYSAFRMSVVGQLTPTLENYIIASFSESETNGYLPKMYVVTNPNGYRAADFAAQIAATPGFWQVANGMPTANQRISQWQVINTTTWEASDDITIKNIVSYAEFRQTQTSSIYGDAGIEPGSFPPLYHYVAPTIFTGPNSRNVLQSTFTEELQLQGRSPDNRLTYQIGGYLERSDPIGGGFQTTYSPQNLACSDVLSLQCVDLRGQLTPAPGGGTREGSIGAISASRNRYNFRNYGIYAQGTYDFTEQLSLTGGIRYTWDRTRGIGRSQRINFPAANTPQFACANPVPLTRGGTSEEILADPSRCDFVRESRSDKPTWLVNLDYKPNPDVLLYAKYARGYRQGSVNIATYGLERWGPEKVDTYEIGAKTSFDGFVSGTFNIAAFYNDFSDQQVQLSVVQCQPGDLVNNPAQCPFIPAQTAGIANAGKSTIKGIEVDASIRPFTGFRVDVGYAYLDTKIKEMIAPPPPLGFTAVRTPPVGGPIPQTPEHKLTVSAAYTLPLDDSIGAITLAGTYVYQDEAFGSTSSTGIWRTLPSQELLNLNLNWDSVAGRPIDLSVFVTNVTKEKFWTFTTGSSFGFDSIIPNQPRMFGVRLKYRFSE